MSIDARHTNQVTIPQEVWEMTQALVEAFDPERMYLFGSWARGDTTPDSDYDLMMIIADSDLPKYKRSRAARGVLSHLTHSKDILVWTRGEFDSRIHLAASLPATILREGVLLYAKLHAHIVYP